MVVRQHNVSIAPGVLPDEQWEVYREVLRGARERGVPFALGGAFGVGVYTGLWRNTKDLDLYVVPEDRDAMIEVFGAAGLADYYDRIPYDRGWIYRGYRGDIIVDVIWSMANRRAQVDRSWFEFARTAVMRGERLQVMPPEELLWQKLYVVQRERCDWPDVLNMFYAAGPEMDWARLIARVGEDWPLLAGVMSLFAWLSPGRARAIPEWVWQRLRIAAPAETSAGQDYDPARVALLDSRPWFVAPRPPR